MKVDSTSALMVTPAYSADCANVEHLAHEGYAKACVVAYWRMMPTKERHDMYMSFVAGKLVCQEHWGGTSFVEPLPSAGFPDGGGLGRKVVPFLGD